MLIATGSIILLLLTALVVVLVYSRNRNLAIIFALAVIVRLVIAVLQEKFLIAGVFDEPAFKFMADGVYEYFLGQRGQLPFEQVSGVPAYGTFMAGIYFFLGKATLMVRIVNVLLSGLLVLMHYQLARQVRLNDREALLIALIVAFTPSYIMLSTLLMRDMVVWVLLVAIVQANVKAVSELALRWLLLGVAISWIATLFRHQYAPIFALLTGLALFLMVLRWRVVFGGVNLGVLKLFLFALVVAGVVVLLYPMMEAELMRNRDASLTEFFSDQMSWRAQGGSAYLTDVEYNSLTDVFIYLPLRFLHFTFGPFFWTVHSGFMMISALEALIGVFFFGMLLRYPGVYRESGSGWLKAAMLYMFAFSMIGLLANATIDSNYGTAMRHRMVYMPLIFIVAMVGRHLRRSSARQVAVESTDREPLHTDHQLLGDIDTV